MGPAGEVQLLVSWHGFEDHDNSWEDISQLIEDAPYRVRNYLAENAAGHPPLQQVYDAEYEWGSALQKSVSYGGSVSGNPV